MPDYSMQNDPTYMAMAEQWNRDAQLNRIVTMLQGIAALITVVYVMHKLIKNQ